MKIEKKKFRRVKLVLKLVLDVMEKQIKFSRKIGCNKAII